MQHSKAVIFDFDDTLVYTNREFNIARDFCIDAILDMDKETNYETVFNEINELDMDKVRELGHFDINIFPEAMEEIYRYHAVKANTTVDERLLAEILRRGYNVYYDTPEVFPHAMEVLGKLKENYNLMLLTQGNVETQKSRIESSGLKHFFDKIYIVKQKTVTTFLDILKEHNLPSNQAIMVGNSVRSDINPALTANMPAIHIHIEEPWSFELAKLESEVPKCTSLRDCVPIIKEVLGH